MRFATTVALSTLALAATATAAPVHDGTSSEGTGRGSCHHHGKSHHKKMSATKCENIKGATVVGYKSDGNCYDKALLSHLATLHPNSSGTCYYVPSKSGSDSDDDSDDRSLEKRTLKKWVMGAAGAALLWHAFKPKAKHQEHHEHHEHHEQQADNQGAPSPAPGNEAREFIDLDDYLYGREFDDLDYYYGRDLDLDVLEGRSVGKVVLGAIAGGWAAHEWDKHEKKEKEEKEKEEEEH